LLLIIVLVTFNSKNYLLACKLCKKNKGMCPRPNWVAPLELHALDGPMHCAYVTPDCPVCRVCTQIESKLYSIFMFLSQFFMMYSNSILGQISHPINIKGHDRSRYPIDQSLQLLSFCLYILLIFALISSKP
jgi:hypothetical protein